MDKEIEQIGSRLIGWDSLESTARQGLFRGTYPTFTIYLLG